MSELALALIRKEKKEKTGILDLGKCGLKDLPEELFDLDWLEDLNLGNHDNYYSNAYRLYQPETSLYNKVSQWSIESRSFEAGVDDPQIHNDFEKTKLGKLKELKNLKFLDLTKTSLKYVDFIFDLVNLTMLNLAHNDNLKLSLDQRIKKKTQQFTKLNLRVLDLSYIEYGCAGWDWDFINKQTIEYLTIRGTRFGSWSELGIGEFTNLRAFDADHHIRDLTGYEEIGRLEKLEFLDISWLDEMWYELEELSSDFLGNLRKLRFLDLVGIRKIKSFDFLENLQELETLNLTRLSLNKVPSSVSRLMNLTTIFLSGNKIESCEALSGLANIKEIDLSYNNLNDISPLQGLNSMERLNLNKNKLMSADSIKALMSLPRLETLFLNDNPLEDIPVTFLGSDASYNCLQPLRSYFKSIAGGFTVKNEIKLILAGNSTAGKTSLRKLLKGEKVDLRELTTHGITCDTWRLSKNNFGNASDVKDIDVHIWDFGGQEYYHATHRLFFTSQSVYILLWEKATNNNDVVMTQVFAEDDNGNRIASMRSLEHFPFEYWLETIRQYDEVKEKSPVLMVQNKIEVQGSKQYIDHKSLEEKYSNLEFFEMSVSKAAEQDEKYLPGYRQFKNTLLEKLSQITLRKNIGSGLARLREEIEGAKNNYAWNYEEYISRIKTLEPDISNSDIDLFTRYLRNEAGVILYYGGNEKLKDTVFLNPVWVIDCIYNVLDVAVFKNNGVFTKDHVVNKNKSGLGTEKLIELMKSFEVIFEDVETADLIAPQFLPEECQNKKAISPYLKKFANLDPSLMVYFPQFLPRSIMLRFLSRFGNKVSGQLYWKNGIAFSTEEKMVYVECSNRQRLIKIQVEDDDLELQHLFFNVIYELCNRNDQMEVAVKGGPDFVNIAELEKQYSLHNPRIESRQGNTVDIQQYEHLILPGKNNRVKDISVFVSYSHEDIDLLKEFRDTHLKSIKDHYAVNLKISTDGKLQPGMNWDNKIKQFLQRATIAVFLISPDFLASDYIKNVEIKTALQRFKEKKQIIIPVLIRPCSKTLLPFKEKQYLPDGLMPVELWPNKDQAWVNVVDGIIRVIDDINQGKCDDYFD